MAKGDVVTDALSHENNKDVNGSNAKKRKLAEEVVSKKEPVCVEENKKRRAQVISPATQIHYPNLPLYIEYGKGSYLYDENDRAYLDLMNNVAHVGHCHPKVVEASHDQNTLLSTNSRFLHDKIVKLAEKLTATLPDKLTQCFFVNSGTEANDLAIRLARNYTNKKDVVVLDDAYHGHSVAVVEISPYKFKYMSKIGQQEHIHVLPRPDTYRGLFQGHNDDPSLGEQYATNAIKIMDDAIQDGREIGLFLAESMMSCGGQIIFPRGYLPKIYEHVHKLGGLCLADEVQVGFGRSGRKGYWGFEQYDVIPDIVTVGKPFGNGHPLSCVITTNEISKAFADTKVAYFNTFGGNPVSMAIGLSVMDVIESENLQENAEIVGQYALKELEKLKEKHTIIGDIRGVGLFIGIELVKNRTTKEPATEETSAIQFRLREEGLLLGKDGPGCNVLKIKPPMVVTKEDISTFLKGFDKILTEFNHQ